MGAEAPKNLENNYLADLSLRTPDGDPGEGGKAPLPPPGDNRRIGKIILKL
jgi:hypothetical protein